MQHRDAWLMGDVDLEQLARRQLADYDRGEPGTAFADGLTLTVEDAYEVQSRVAALRVARGERVIGYKVGCTSPVIRKRLGAKGPVFGRLFDSECFSSGARLPASRFSNLAIEGELAVKLAQDFHVNVTGMQGRPISLRSILPVVELHNLVFRGGQPCVDELIANNAIHAGFVCADDETMQLKTLSSLRIDIDGKEVAVVSERELTQTLSKSLQWLATELSRQGQSLKAGQTVLCGSVADLFPVTAGRIEVTADAIGFVECTIENDG